MSEAETWPEGNARLQQLRLPDAVAAGSRALQKPNTPVYLVGGAVRDAMFGRPPSGDFDLATSLRPEQVQAALPGSAIVDQHLGAVEWQPTGSDGPAITVTTFRTEADYLDQRHPQQVTFVNDPALDALRRDFTINAIYLELGTGVVVDPVGGAADLRDRRLQVIGAEAERLHEDPLRLLRAVRFAARFDLQPTASTLTALRATAAQVRTLSVERVFAELTNAFTGPGRGSALQRLVDWQLAAHVLPEVVPMDGVEQPPQYHPEGDVLTHVCMVLDQAVAEDPVQAWSAVLHDLGKPATFERAADRIRFHGHDQLSAEMAETVLRRFHAPKQLRDTVVEVCRDHIRFATILEMGRAKRERWMRSPHFEAHLEFHRADCMGSHGKLHIYEEAKRMWQELPPEPPPPLCTGQDLRELGVAEGPMIGRLLRTLAEELERDEVTDRQDALARLRKLVEARFSEPS